MDWVITYVVIALLCWGFFIGWDDTGPATPTMNFLMAAIWPVAWLLIIGAALASAASEERS